MAHKSYLEYLIDERRYLLLTFFWKLSLGLTNMASQLHRRFTCILVLKVAEITITLGLLALYTCLLETFIIAEAVAVVLYHYMRYLPRPHLQCGYPQHMLKLGNARFKGRIGKPVGPSSFSMSLFIGLSATTLFAPLVAAVVTSGFTNNWSFPSTISQLASTSIEATVTATPIQAVLPSPEDAVRTLGYDLIVWLLNLLLALVLVAIWFGIYWYQCHCKLYQARSRKWDKTRWVGLCIMLGLFGLYIFILGDSRSQWGLLLGIWLGQGGFTYVWANRIATRFRFGYFYGIGVVVGGVVAMLTIVSKMPTMASPPSIPPAGPAGPSVSPPSLTANGPLNLRWDQVFWPCIALVCAIVELAWECGDRNMAELPLHRPSGHSIGRSTGYQSPASDRRNFRFPNPLPFSPSSGSMNSSDGAHAEHHSDEFGPAASNHGLGSYQESRIDSSCQADSSEHTGTASHALDPSAQSGLSELPPPNIFTDSYSDNPSSEENPWYYS